MALDPHNEEDEKRLRRAITSGRNNLSFVLKCRNEMLRQIVGSRYGENGSTEKVPINMLGIASQVYMRKLVARQPRALVTTDVSNLKYHAATETANLNHTMVETEFETSLQESVREALISFGVTKLGIEAGSRTAERFVKNISPDNWFHSAIATRWSESTFFGDRYMGQLDDVKSNDSYDKEVRDRLISNPVAADEDTPKAKEISQKKDAMEEERDYEKYVELQDVFLPNEGLLVTMPAHQNGVLKVVKWKGPEHGPYHMLGFTAVQDNLLPLPPLQQLFDLHFFLNQLFLKLGRQAAAEKTAIGYAPGAEADAERLLSAMDFEMIEMQNPDQVKEFHLGGTDARTFALFLQARQLFNWQAGNLDLMGGLGTSSPTYSQDAMLKGAASELLADMQRQVVAYVKKLLYDLAWYDWNDSVQDRMVPYQIPGTNITVMRRAAFHMREGQFDQYTFDIVPYSLQDQSPQQRLQTLTAVVQNVIGPNAPMMAQQGVGVDWRKLMSLYGVYGELPELAEILTFTGGPTEQTSGVPMLERGSASPVTHRTQERVHRSGQSPDDALIQQLLSSREPSGAGVAA